MKKLLLLVAVASVSGAMAMDKDGLANKIAMNRFQQKQGHQRTNSDIGPTDRQFVPSIDSSSWEPYGESNANLNRNDSFTYEGGNDLDESPIKKVKKPRKPVKSSLKLRKSMKQPRWIDPRFSGKRYGFTGGRVHPYLKSTKFRK